MLKPYYQKNGITIFHGDCLEVLPRLQSESIDFALTDPPYLVNYTGRWDRKHEAIEGDDESGWLLPSFQEIYRLLKPDSLCVSFYGWPHAHIFLRTWKEEIGFRPLSHLCFVKRAIGLGRYTRSKHESAYLLGKGHPPLPETAVIDTIEWVRENEAFHPNQKPVSALLPLLSAYTQEGQVVLDPFMGSGSTLRGALDLNCRAVGVEIDERYCELAAKRMEQGVLFTRKRKAPILHPMLFTDDVPERDGNT